jgi:hypothetical protein
MTSPASPTPASANAPSLASRLAPAPLPRPRRELRAPNWLQVCIIFALLGSAAYVALDGRYLWCALLAVAGLAFGASFLLRYMVGDDYGRA